MFDYQNRKLNGKNKQLKIIIRMNFSFNRNESILDEKYIEIQNIATKHLTTLQSVVTALKKKRKDVSPAEFSLIYKFFE